ncbi:hypothetical protein FG386_002497 [Cryptosporidium ryanae]|uniref:uncharacterized protein n=1 Tax=Cryptosporidium ryanae TaxID=515981 RepID=UPI00351AAC83|nr:hypothetical protein FG386_002497 [Cryptosporidium ryanae]
MFDSDSDIPLSNKLNKSSKRNSNGPESKKCDLTKKSSKKSTKRKVAVAKKGKVSLEKKKPTKSSNKARHTTKTSIGKKKKSENNSDIDETSKDFGKLFREGQKYITPPNGDATRAFYESLYEENPYSIIALKYCVENGVLLGNKHVIAYERLEFLRENGFLKRSVGGLQEEAIEQLKLFDSKRCGFPRVRDLH